MLFHLEFEKRGEDSQYTCFHVVTSGKMNIGVTRGKDITGKMREIAAAASK